MEFSLHPADVAFGAAFSFLAGLFAAGAGWPLYVVFAVALLAAAATVARERRLARECALFLAALVAGALYYHAFFAVAAARTNIPIGKPLVFSAVIVDEPQAGERSLMLTAAAAPPLRGIFTLFAPLGADLAYGDLVEVRGTISAPDRPGAAPVMFSPQIAFVAAHRGFFLREWMLRLKAAILARFREALPEDEAALLGGITFGSRASFAPALKNAMALSGTTHLVAVSGYNITIVIAAAGALFGRLLPRRATFAAAAALLALFMLMVGGQASAVRAAIMGFIALAGREMGEAASMRNLITFTAAAMALGDPSILTANAGFLLSFASLLGIVYLGPPLRKLLRYDRGDGAGLLGWKESAATTLAAQLAVMPVLLRTFGQFSLAAIFANTLVLATVPLTMALGALLAALGFLSRALAFFAAQLAGLFLGYQLSVIRLFAALAVPLPFHFGSAFFVAFYYFLLAIFIFSYGAAPRRGRAHGNDASKESDPT